MTQLCAIGEVGDASAGEGLGFGAVHGAWLREIHGLELSELSGRRKDEAAARLRELLTLIRVELYGPRVKDLS